MMPLRQIEAAFDFYARSGVPEGFRKRAKEKLIASGHTVPAYTTDATLRLALVTYADAIAQVEEDIALLSTDSKGDPHATS